MPITVTTAEELGVLKSTVLRMTRAASNRYKGMPPRSGLWSAYGCRSKCNPLFPFPLLRPLGLLLHGLTSLPVETTLHGLEMTDSQALAGDCTPWGQQLQWRTVWQTRDVLERSYTAEGGGVPPLPGPPPLLRFQCCG